MAAGAITVKQNSNQTIGLHFTDNAGADLNITGKTVTLYVSRGIDQPNLITKTVTVHTDPTHGKTQIALLAADLNLYARGYSYELWLDTSPTDIGSFIVEDTLT